MFYSRKSLSVIIVASGVLVGGVAAGTAQANGGPYGAIAVGTFEVGHATDFPTQAAADRAALDACGVDWCRVTLRLKNDCGAVVEYDARGLWGTIPSYYHGTGRTASDAERMARTQVPHTVWGVVARTALGSSVPLEPYVRLSVCSGIAG